MKQKKLWVVALSLLLYFCTSSPKTDDVVSTQKKDFSHLEKPPKLKLLWMSLDAFSINQIEPYLDLIKDPHPYGLNYIVNQSKKISELRINDPTLTAPSHISTITCSPPQEHGIIGNQQWNGKDFENGFDKKYSTQTFIKSMMQSGWKVGSFAYPTIDGNGEERKSSFGLTYDVSPTKGFFALIPVNGSAQLEIPIRDKNENYKIEGFADTSGSVVTYQHNKTKLAHHSNQTWANIYFKVGEGLQHIAILNLGTDGKKVRVYVTPTMRNSAYPQTFLKDLNSQNLVFSSGKDFKLKKQEGDKAFIKSLEHRLEFMGDSARYALLKENPDAFFLYLEDLDSIGHSFAGRTDINKILEHYVSMLDQEIGKIIELVNDDTTIVVMGDHGMSATKMVVNANALIPSNARPFTTAQSTGGALYIYPRGKFVTSNPPVNEKWFLDMVQKLKDAKLPNQQVIFTSVVTKNSPEAKNLKIDHKNLPWMVAFANPGLQIENSSEDRLVLDKAPNPVGNHGYSSFSKEMKASFVIFGKKSDAVDLKKIHSNIDVVPLVADALGVKRPEACRNKSY